MYRHPGITDLAGELVAAARSSTALVEQALNRACDPNGEGERVFLSLYDAQAADAAALSDRMRGHNVVPSSIAGLPVAISDAFDVAGETTAAGSAVLADAPVAAADATVVAALRAAGAVLIGRTNMSEFGISALGLNPHFGTPGNPYDANLIPGGAASGAAVAVVSGMAVAAVGTDGAGSIRIPAALCGAVGTRSSAGRISLSGTLPQAPSVDAIGTIAPDVESCAIMDSILSGNPAPVFPDLSADGLRLAVPVRYVLDDLDLAVAAAFQATLVRLKAAGVRLFEITLAELEEIPAITADASFAAVEGYAWHRHLLSTSIDRYDPRVVQKLRRGSDVMAADYIELIAARRDLIRRINPLTAPFDAVIMPTVPHVAPSIASLQSDYIAYTETNSLFMRNAAIANFLDRCAITLPCQEDGDLPVGLTLMGETGGDARLFVVARAVERVLAR